MAFVKPPVRARAEAESAQPARVNVVDETVGIAPAEPLKVQAAEPQPEAETYTGDRPAWVTTFGKLNEMCIRDSYNGGVNDILAIFGIGKIDWMKSSYAQIVIVLLFLWKNLGYNMILFMAALGSIPKDIIEVVRLDSSSSWQTFIHVKLRYLSSTILFVTIMSLKMCIRDRREYRLISWRMGKPLKKTL